MSDVLTAVALWVFSLVMTSALTYDRIKEKNWNWKTEPLRKEIEELRQQVRDLEAHGPGDPW